jgi:hypothetical protein
MKEVDLTPGARQERSDSDYAVVGEWRVEDQENDHGAGTTLSAETVVPAP